MINDKINSETNLRFLIGGIFAAALPVMIGIVLFAIPIIAENDSSCTYRAFRANDDVTSLCQFYHWMDKSFYWPIMMPIILSFIFIAPIVAIRSISELRKNDLITWHNIFIVSFSNSTKVNFWVAILFNSVVFLMLIAAAIGMSGGGNIFGSMIMALFYLALIQFVLWLCITVLLSLICAAIFGLTVKPHVT